MRILLYICSLFFSYSITAQNLISNGSFELFHHCPFNANDLDSVVNWYNPNISTPNYFNQCSTGSASVPANPFGYQPAHSGNAYAGIYQYWSNVSQYREYIETPLDSTLTINNCYHFEMYINSSDIAKYACSNIGVYFSDSLILATPTGVLSSFNPQIQNSTTSFPDTSNWVVVSGDYIAQGGERYLIIGNFLQDNLLNQSVIDPSGYDMSYVYIDDVSLIPCSSVGIDEWHKTINVVAYPNPVTDILTISSNESINSYELIDITGKSILKQQENRTQLNINMGSLSEGLYLLKIRTNDKVYVEKIIKK